MSRQGQEVLEVFVTEMAEHLHHHHVDCHRREQLWEDEKECTGKSVNGIITCLICISVISVIILIIVIIGVV